MGASTSAMAPDTTRRHVNGVVGMVELLASEGGRYNTVLFDFDSTLVADGKVHSPNLATWVRENGAKCWILTARSTKEKLQLLVDDLRTIGLAKEFGVPSTGDVAVEHWVGDSLRVTGARIIGTGPYRKGEVAQQLLAKLPGPILFFDDNPFNAVELDALDGVSGCWVDLFDEWMAGTLRLDPVEPDCAYKAYFQEVMFEKRPPHAPILMARAEWQARREKLQAHFVELATRAGDEREAAELRETAINLK